MPTIRQYTNEDNALQPGQGGAAATARAAIRMNALGQEQAGDIRRTGAAWQSAFSSIDQGLEKVGKVVGDWQTAKELNVFNAALMNTHAELDQDWSKTRANTDPTQPAGADWLAQNAGPKLDKLMDGIGTEAGRKHAEAVIQQAKMHYLHSTTVDDQTAAGEGIVRNMETVVNGATLRSNRDFSTVQYNSEQIKNSYDMAIKTGNLSPAAASKLREARDKAVVENNVAGLMGAATRNPGAFLVQLKAGAFDNFGIGAKEVQHLEHYAKVQQKSHESDARNAAVNAQIATRKSSEAEMQRIRNESVQPDGTVKIPSFVELSQNKKLTFDDYTQSVRFYQAISKEPAQKDDGDAVTFLYENYKTKQLTMDQVTELAESKKLTPKTADRWRDRVLKQENFGERENSANEAGFLKGIRTDLGLDSFGMPPPGAGEKADQIRLWSDNYIKEQRRQGVSEFDIFDKDGKAYIRAQPGFRARMNESAGPSPLDILKESMKPKAPPAPAPVPGGAPTAPTSLKLPPKSKSLDDIMGGKK